MAQRILKGPVYSLVVCMMVADPTTRKAIEKRYPVKWWCRKPKTCMQKAERILDRLSQDKHIEVWVKIKGERSMVTLRQGRMTSRGVKATPAARARQNFAAMDRKAA